MLLSAVLAASLAFVPELPDGVPDISTWEVVRLETLERTNAHDLLRSRIDSGTTIKFIQTRGICPEEETGVCRYTVLHELRRVMIGDRMYAFVQRYVILGANGVRAEGLLLMRLTEPRSYSVFFRRNGSWLIEDAPCLELETAVEFFAMLSEQRQEPLL